MYREKHYDYSGIEGKWIKDELKKRGFHHVTISNFPADFFRMSKSQLEKLFEKVSDAFISEMYDVPIRQIQNRRDDFGIKQLTNTLNRMEREDEAAQIFKEILRIVSNEYNNGNIPHTNSTPLNSEKEFLYMKATGIVRRIDDLGRVVIPKEIRRTMRIREGDPLEIFTEKDGEVVFKKYSPVGELSPFAVQYADVLSRACNMTVLVCDRDHVIAAAGPNRKEFYDRRVSAGLDDVMESRQTYVAVVGGNHRLQPVEAVTRFAAVASPILAAGDITGAVCLIQPESGAAPGEGDIRLAQVAAAFLGKQMEE